MRKTNILDLGRMKGEGQKIVMITAYDALFARIFDDVGVDVILVGDSLGQVVLGHSSTLNVTMEDMVRHTEAAAQGRKRAVLVAGGGGGGRKAGGGVQRRGDDPRDRFGGHPRDGTHRAHPAVGPPDGRIPGAGEDRLAAGTAPCRGRRRAGGGRFFGGARGDALRAGRGDHPDPVDPHDRDRRGGRLRRAGAGDARPPGAVRRVPSEVREALRRAGRAGGGRGRGVRRRGARRVVSRKGALFLMERLRTPGAMRAWGDARRAGGGRGGLVPTMGYLHEGHVSLVRIAKARGCGAVAATIFVNPTQFGPGEDFEKYPRDEARDLAMLDAAGVDAGYLPGGGGQ